MKENVIKVKSSQFSIRIVFLTRQLKEKRIEATLVNQILKSGTSIGANVEEACAGISKAEFSMKISISYKEAKETLYWLNVLKNTNTISFEEYTSLYNDCDEIARILWAILKTTRMNGKK
jgi:four helix bundle protein